MIPLLKYFQKYLHQPPVKLPFSKNPHFPIHYLPPGNPNRKSPLKINTPSSLAAASTLNSNAGDDATTQQNSQTELTTLGTATSNSSFFCSSFTIASLNSCSCPKQTLNDSASKAYSDNINTKSSLKAIRPMRPINSTLNSNAEDASKTYSGNINTKSSSKAIRPMRPINSTLKSSSKAIRPMRPINSTLNSIAEDASETNWGNIHTKNSPKTITSTINSNAEDDFVKDDNMLEHQSFLDHLSIIRVTNVATHTINSPTYKELHQVSDSIDVICDIQTTQRVFLRPPQLYHFQIIANCDLEDLRELSSGALGKVYHGKWRGAYVVIKRMWVDFWNETSIHTSLHHPNIVTFYGIVLDGLPESLSIVIEYMVNGSLRNALLSNDRAFDQSKRLLVAMDVAFGMEYLHKKNIIHFDLKSDNLFIDLRDHQRAICKVGDFGLSKMKSQRIPHCFQGILPWMAPELMNDNHNLISEKVDVFSFGIVMWELLTGEEPYTNLDEEEIISGIKSNILRPQIPESCDPEWRILMQQCWSTEPSERPCFTEISRRLHFITVSLS